MARSCSVNFALDNGVLTVSRFYLDNSGADTIYTLPDLPPYASVDEFSQITIDCDLFFSTMLDCYCFEDEIVNLNGEHLSVINDSNYIYPEDVVYFDIDSVYKYAGLPVPALPPLQGSLPSLNGNGSEFLDGDVVTVTSRSGQFTVQRSYSIMYADNSYTNYYDLVSDVGAKLSCPESLLTAYIPSVTTP